MSSKLYLKIKLKSLAEEAKIIRKEENKYKYASRNYRITLDNVRVCDEAKADELIGIYENLRSHRVGNVRHEARDSHIAYGFLRGKLYKVVETPSPNNPPNLRNIVGIIQRFGGDRKFSIEDLSAWMKAN